MKKPPSSAFIIITPVFEDKDASNILFKQLFSEFGKEVYMVVIDDGSVIHPLAVTNLSETDLTGIVIKLRRNVGHQRAIAIGLNYVAANLPDYPVVIMDSDGEDQPHTVKNLLKALLDQELDIVVATRKTRVETLRFKYFYAIYKILFRLLTGRTLNFGNFMALKPSAVKRLACMQEIWIHIAGSTLISKLRLSRVSLPRGARYAGQSKMNFVSLALHGFKSLMVFAEDLLVRVGIVCAIIAALSILSGFIAISLKIMGFATPGWFSIALGILFQVFLQTGTLTLMTLLLTGVLRGELVINIAYQNYIDEILHTNSD